MRIIVVFPAPFGPSRPETFPGRTRKLTRSTASTLDGRSAGPYHFVRSRTSMAGTLWFIRQRLLVG